MEKTCSSFIYRPIGCRAADRGLAGTGAQSQEGLLQLPHAKFSKIASYDYDDYEKKNAPPDAATDGPIENISAHLNLFRGLKDGKHVRNLPKEPERFADGEPPRPGIGNPYRCRPFQAQAAALETQHGLSRPWPPQSCCSRRSADLPAVAATRTGGRPRYPTAACRLALLDALRRKRHRLQEDLR